MIDCASAKCNRLVQYGAASLKHEEFLKLRSEFDFVKQNGTKFVSKSFILLYILPPPDGKRRIGIICGRKFDKRAVTRNRVRRIFKESFRLIKNQVALSHMLFIPRKGAEQRKAQYIQYEMIETFQKVTLWIEIPKA
jgi:ribonuclease P protein component